MAKYAKKVPGVCFVAPESVGSVVEERAANNRRPKNRRLGGTFINRSSCARASLFAAFPAHFVCYDNDRIAQGYERGVNEVGRKGEFGVVDTRLSCVFAFPLKYRRVGINKEALANG